MEIKKPHVSPEISAQQKQHKASDQYALDVRVSVTTDPAFRDATGVGTYQNCSRGCQTVRGQSCQCNHSTYESTCRSYGVGGC